MASRGSIWGEEVPRSVLDDLIHLLWGTNINEDIFQRWNQGFTFGDDEPTALLQYDGGPCAVIVPIQAFLLKNLLFSTTPAQENWRQTCGAERDSLLCATLADVLCRAAGNGSSLVLCHSVPPGNAAAAPLPGADTPTPSPAEAASPPSDVAAASAATDVEMKSGDEAVMVADSVRPRLSPDDFHSTLRQIRCNNRDDVVGLLNQSVSVRSSQRGVLLFLYSLLLTKGLDRIRAEKADGDEPLIDPIHGHGSQSLINLLLTGLAVPHVWDGEKNVSGLKLQGISSRSEIGFLTLLEHLRYCEVGWYLKNPSYPIWLLGSETHLTVLFSEDRTLVGDENPQEVVRRAFSRFDEEGRGFVNADNLGDLMQQLDLVSEPEYVKIMADKLDPEQLGVITFDSFVGEFYPGLFTSGGENSIRPFSVFHYNGLRRSAANKVTYARGSCTVPDMPELQMISDFSPIKTCLLTKWPTIELAWDNGSIPSMN